MRESPLAPRARELRQRGMSYGDACAVLGVSKSHYYRLLNDPTGEKDKARKRRYATPCVDCGAPTSGRANGLDRIPDRCADCAKREAHAAKAARTKVILRELREWADTHGRPPTYEEWVDPSRDVTHSGRAVQDHFGSWNAGLAAAGLAPRYSPPGAHSLAAEDRDLTIALYEEGHTIVAISRTFGVTPNAIRQRLKRAGVHKPVLQRRRSNLAPFLSAQKVLDREIGRHRLRIERIEEERAALKRELEKLQRARDQLTTDEVPEQVAA